MQAPIGRAIEASSLGDAAVAVVGDAEFGDLSGRRAESYYLSGSGHSSSEYASSRLKRWMDCAISLLLLFVFSPLCAVVAGLILYEDRGPILFRQRRVGRGGRPFTVLKFRTMRTDAEEQLVRWQEANSPIWQEYVANNFKLRGDPRVTRVGRFLHRHSLGEIPQLWNVLCDDMSMVEPRPLLASELSDYGACIRNYTRVKPGVTGLWQVRGRSETRFADRARYDGFYIKRANFGLDVRIIVQTVFVMLTTRGAC